MKGSRREDSEIDLTQSQYSPDPESPVGRQ